MATKRIGDRNNRKPQKAVSRRDFVKSGAAAGAGAAAVFSTSGTALSQVSPAQAVQWHYEADVVVIGAGCTGLPAAIRARDLGASVIVVDQNFDIGGKMLHSGGQISLGGGDPLQLRDIKGESDREGFVTAPTRHSVEELTEDPDFLSGTTPTGRSWTPRLRHRTGTTSATSIEPTPTTAMPRGNS